MSRLIGNENVYTKKSTAAVIAGLLFIKEKGITAELSADK
jgi:hypothetical protein